MPKHKAKQQYIKDHKVNEIKEPVMVFYRNYDYNDDDPSGPGEGLYSGKMDKYDSVDDFRNKKEKRQKRKQKEALLAFLDKRATNIYNEIQKNSHNTTNDNKFINVISELANIYDDLNDLNDPTEGVVESIPFSPAETNQLGIMDNFYPKEDLEDKPVSNLYYGRLETHPASDGKIKSNKKA